jgi:hypothetical protein
MLENMVSVANGCFVLTWVQTGFHATSIEFDETVRDVIVAIIM